MEPISVGRKKVCFVCTSLFEEEKASLTFSLALSADPARLMRSLGSLLEDLTDGINPFSRFHCSSASFRAWLADPLTLARPLDPRPQLDAVESTAVVIQYARRHTHICSTQSQTHTQGGVHVHTETPKHPHNHTRTQPHTSVTVG